MRFDNRALARSKVARLDGERPLPARLIKYVSILIPDAGPFGETRREARDLAMAEALLVKRPGGG